MAKNWFHEKRYNYETNEDFQLKNIYDNSKNRYPLSVEISSLYLLFLLINNPSKSGTAGSGLVDFMVRKKHFLFIKKYRKK